MKRILLIGLMVLAMVQCSSISSTEDATIDKLNTDISVPKITLSDGQIVWDDIDGVDAYEILIIDFTPNASCYIMKSEVIKVSDNVYNIESLTDNHQWDIKVRAVIEHEYSLYSEPLIIDTFEDLHITYDITYNTQSNHNYLVVPNVLKDVLFIKYTYLGEEQFLQTDDYMVENNHLYIRYDALSFIDSEQTFNIYTKEGIDRLLVSTIDRSTPVMLTNDYIEYQGEDIVVVFDLAGGVFDGLTGEGVSSEDYLFDDNVLVIDHAFIDQVFDSDETKENIVFMYHISLDDDVYEGYIYIKK